MNMQKQIEEVVRAHNDRWLIKGGLPMSASGTYDSGVIGTASGISKSSNPCLLGGSGLAAVGAVIDSSTNMDVAHDCLVLAVGINYGQGNQYLTPDTSKGGAMPTTLYDDTKMRSRLALALKQARLSRATIPYDGYLVAANFFPFITEHSWSNTFKNSIEEAIVFKHYGWTDPIKQVCELYGSLGTLCEEQDRKLIVVFHGACNAVPILGLEAVIRGKTSNNSAVILCDNLAHGSGMKNALKL